MTQHLLQRARFYFKYVWGDKDLFRLGFKVSIPLFDEPYCCVNLTIQLVNAPYFLNPNYLTPVGLLVSNAKPMGGALLDSRGALFCGQSMLQKDFDELNPLSPTEGGAKPLFMHANGLKLNYRANVPPFQVAQDYVIPAGKRIEDFDGARARWIGALKSQNHCVDLAEVRGLSIRTYS